MALSVYFGVLFGLILIDFGGESALTRDLLLGCVLEVDNFIVTFFVGFVHPFIDIPENN